tara:strand:- start:33 stop:323 length:291 start_codon:yes stop_codon:yes gene_type:complete
MTNKLKALKKSDHVSIVFGEWFDKSAGNTYYDALVRINDSENQVPYQYGYNAGSSQSIDEALEYCGYHVRNSSKDRFIGYREVHHYCTDKLKSELF